MKRLMLHAGVFAAGAMIAAFSWPQAGHHRKPGLSAAYEELKLPAAVHEELKRLDDKVGPQCIEMGRKRRELYAELGKERHDDAVVARLTEEVGAIRVQIQRDMVAHLVSIKPHLDAGQRERLFARLREERR